MSDFSANKKVIIRKETKESDLIKKKKKKKGQNEIKKISFLKKGNQFYENEIQSSNCQILQLDFFLQKENFSAQSKNREKRKNFQFF